METESIKNAIRTLENMFSCEDSGKKIEALRMAINALQMQIPQKPIREKWLPTICPNCGKSLSKSLGDGFYKDIEKEFCDCGQRLEWD